MGGERVVTRLAREPGKGKGRRETRTPNLDYVGGSKLAATRPVSGVL